MGDYIALEIGVMWEVETHATSHLSGGVCEGAPPPKKKKKKNRWEVETSLTLVEDPLLLQLCVHVTCIPNFIYSLRRSFPHATPLHVHTWHTIVMNYCVLWYCWGPNSAVYCTDSSAYPLHLNRCTNIKNWEEENSHSGDEGVILCIW